MKLAQNLCLTLLLIFPLGAFATGGGGEDDKNYVKYEREEVSAYRARTNFELPVPEVATQAIDEERPEVVSLSYLFSGGKKVHVQAANGLDELVERHIRIGENTKTMQGYRIRIYAGPVRQRALDRKKQMMMRYPEVPYHIDFRSPNYIVLVGDFLEEETAILFLRDLRETFPDAFMVPDEVNVPRYRPERYDEEETEAYDLDDN